VVAGSRLSATYQAFSSAVHAAAADAVMTSIGESCRPVVLVV
jgi:hypothetical protein